MLMMDLAENEEGELHFVVEVVVLYRDQHTFSM